MEQSAKGAPAIAAERHPTIEGSTRPSAKLPMHIIGKPLSALSISVGSAPPGAQSSGGVVEKPRDCHHKDAGGGTTATVPAPRMQVEVEGAIAAVNSDPGRPQRPPAALVLQQHGATTSRLAALPQLGLAPSTGDIATAPIKRTRRPPKTLRLESAADPSAAALSGPNIIKRKPGRQRKMAQPESTAPSAGVAPSQAGIPVKRGRGRPPNRSRAGASAPNTVGVAGQAPKRRGRPPMARPAQGLRIAGENTGSARRGSAQAPAALAAAAAVRMNNAVPARRLGRPPKQSAEADAGALLLGLSPPLPTQARKRSRSLLAAVPQRKRGRPSSRPSADDGAARAAAEPSDRAVGNRSVGRRRKMLPSAPDQPGSRPAASGKQRAQPGLQSDGTQNAGSPPGKVKRKYKTHNELGNSGGPMVVVTAKRSKVAAQMLARTAGQVPRQQAATPLAHDMDVACFASICKTMGSALESGTVGDSVRKETLWQVAQHALGPSKLPADQDRFGAADAWLAAMTPLVVERHWKRVLAYIQNGVPRALMQHLRIAIDDFLRELAIRSQELSLAASL